MAFAAFQLDAFQSDSFQSDSGADAETISYESRLRLAEIWARLELDAANPVVITPSQLTVGTITQSLADTGSTRTGATLPLAPLTADEILLEIWQRLGLDASNPLVQTTDTISVGGIGFIVTDVAGTVTVERQ